MEIDHSVCMAQQSAEEAESKEVETQTPKEFLLPLLRLGTPGVQIKKWKKRKLMRPDAIKEGLSKNVKKPLQYMGYDSPAVECNDPLPPWCVLLKDARYTNNDCDTICGWVSTNDELQVLLDNYSRECLASYVKIRTGNGPRRHATRGEGSRLLWQYNWPVVPFQGAPLQIVESHVQRCQYGVNYEHIYRKKRRFQQQQEHEDAGRDGSVTKKRKRAPTQLFTGCKAQVVITKVALYPSYSVSASECSDKPAMVKLMQDLKSALSHQPLSVSRESRYLLVLSTLRCHNHVPSGCHRRLSTYIKQRIGEYVSQGITQCRVIQRGLHADVQAATSNDPCPPATCDRAYYPKLSDINSYVSQYAEPTPQHSTVNKVVTSSQSVNTDVVGDASTTATTVSAILEHNGTFYTVSTPTVDTESTLELLKARCLSALLRIEDSIQECDDAGIVAQCTHTVEQLADTLRNRWHSTVTNAANSDDIVVHGDDVVTVDGYSLGNIQSALKGIQCGSVIVEGLQSGAGDGVQVEAVEYYPMDVDENILQQMTRENHVEPVVQPTKRRRNDSSRYKVHTLQDCFNGPTQVQCEQGVIQCEQGVIECEQGEQGEGEQGMIQSEQGVTQLGTDLPQAPDVSSQIKSIHKLPETNKVIITLSSH